MAHPYQEQWPLSSAPNNMIATIDGWLIYHINDDQHPPHSWERFSEMRYHKGFKMVLARELDPFLPIRNFSWWSVIPFNERGVCGTYATIGACMRAIESRFAPAWSPSNAERSLDAPVIPPTEPKR
jgi:hypothetical protein